MAPTPEASIWSALTPTLYSIFRLLSRDAGDEYYRSSVVGIPEADAWPGARSRDIQETREAGKRCSPERLLDQVKPDFSDLE